MMKADLEALVLAQAAIARTEMIERRGTYEQRALLIDGRGRPKLIVNSGAPLHGPHMAAVLRIWAAGLSGGADAILVMADCRGREISPQEERDFKRGDIAVDPHAIEMLVTAGRSREHVVAVIDKYQRPPDGVGITFATPVPVFDPDWCDIQTGMIPDVWEKFD